MNTPTKPTFHAHARHSLLVNGLTPREWRWGADVFDAFKRDPMHNYMVAGDPPLNFPKGCLLIWHDLPVFPMKANGVACIARTNSTHGKHNFTF